jgi:2'-5' RNA ligase
VGFGEGVGSDSFDGGVIVGGLSGFGVRRPDCACPRQQTIKTKKTLNEMFKHDLMNLILNSFSPHCTLTRQRSGRELSTVIVSARFWRIYYY